MCEITESESVERRLESLAAENERLSLAAAVEQARAEDALESLATEVLRLRAENERLECGVAFGVLEQLRERVGLAERELAAVIEMHISPNEDGIWYLDLPIAARDMGYHYQTSHEAAVAAVRKAAGLDAEPAGEEGGD